MASAMSMPMAEPSLQMKLPVAGQMMPQPPGIPKGMMGAQRDRLRIDPKRALEPTRKKLSTLESQRIMAVVLDSIRKMEVMAALPTVLNDLPRFSIVLGAELVEVLERHKVILDSYAELHTTVNKYRKEYSATEFSTRSLTNTQSALSNRSTRPGTEKSVDIADQTDTLDGVQDSEHDPDANIEVTAERPGINIDV